MKHRLTLTTSIAKKWELLSPVCRLFVIAAFTAFLLFLPYLFYDHGIFLLYGDYNVQQVPFYILAHDAIRNGSFGFNFFTDLGSNFIASYSFYLLGSPFFWLTIPFDTQILPYLMAPLFILKFAVAAVTSYLFIRRFTKTDSPAMIGALLYAFSGFMIYNIFYNHFHEVVAFFPLLLIGLEDFIVHKKRGRFAAAIALNLIVNYYFFVAEAVFLLLYFCVRCVYKSYSFTLSEFILLLFEGLLGVAMGMILFLPSAFMILQNPRVAHMLLGYDMLFYSQVQRYGLILQSLFFPPDMPAYPNLFRNADAKWYSVAAYLPLFGMTGVITFIQQKKKHFLRCLLILLMVFMFIPILNSAFNGLNASYYARWFFAFTLMGALATAIALDNSRISWNFGLKFCAFMVMIFIIIGLLPSQEDGEIHFCSLPTYPAFFFIIAFLTLAGIFVIAVLMRRRQNLQRYSLSLSGFYKTLSFCLCAFILLYGHAELSFGKYQSAPAYQNVVDRGLQANFTLDSLEDSFYRVDVYDENALDNWPMFWKLPSIQAFQSTVSPSIFSFYKELGITRDVASRIPSSYIGLRGLLSVKYLFALHADPQNPQSLSLPAGFVYDHHENDFDIYKNNAFVPMGFYYTHYIDETTFKQCPEKKRDRLLLKGLYCDGVSMPNLTPLSKEDAKALSDEDYLHDTAALQTQACTSFSIDRHGFSALANVPNDNYLFFSVPYDEGFTAYINGNKTPILKAANGMMAVPCKAGENTVRFVYHTPYLRLGAFITFSGALILAIYLFIHWRCHKKRPHHFSKKSPLD